jgi:CDP-6-deoxy-D-xylo-4-hexulose-3-dehydrase
MKINYPLISDSWGKEEKAAINKVVKSNIYTYQGKFVKEFEDKFSKYFGLKYGVFVNSGSSANLLAIAALFFKKKNPLKKGDEVIVPALSWATTYHPLQQYGLKLRFVDINLKTLNTDAEQMIRAVTKSTKLIVAVSILGNPAEVDKLSQFCKKRNIYLLEDNCESMGARINGKYTGTFGTLNTYSTFFSHHISTIEGGLVLTDDKELYNLILSLRSHGWTRDIQDKNFYLKKFQKKYEDYCFVLPGYNLRPTNISAAVGLEQLKKLDRLLTIRKKNHNFFLKLFSQDKRFIIQKIIGEGSAFAFTFVIKKQFLNLKSKIFLRFKKFGIQYRLITGGSFFMHPVKKFYNFTCYKKMTNVNYIHKNGFFVGNHPKDLKKELLLLKKALNF